MIRREKKSATHKRKRLGLRRRGAGNRGGRGNCGMGKKSAAQKRPTKIKLGLRFGQHGFTNPTSKPQSIINVCDLDKHAQKGEVNTIKLGYDKVGGKGRVSQSLKVTAKAFTSKAKSKIESAKGQALVM